ncbi:MAG: hypothetical protein KHX40_00240 [Oscillospiraceae bacterium]|nr:hypothetical protein [Oscillospiraceae bacterium]
MYHLLQNRYANHYATIRKWLDEDSKPKPGKNYDYMLRSPNCSFVLFVGSKKLVKRKEFEQYISQALVI